MHKSGKNYALKHLTKAGSEGDRPEFISSRLWYRNNCVGGPGRRHMPQAEAKVKEMQ